MYQIESLVVALRKGGWIIARNCNLQKGQGAHKTLGGNVAMACSNSQNNAFAEYYGFPNLCITLKIISQNLEGKIEINKKTFEPKFSFIFMYNPISWNQRFVVCCSWSQKASLCFKKHNTSWVIFVTSLCTVSLLTSVRLVSCLQKKENI